MTSSPTTSGSIQNDGTPQIQIVTAITLQQQSTPSSTAPEFRGITPSITQPTHPPKLSQLIKLGRAYLAEHLEMPVDQVALLEYQAIDFPDISSGCSDQDIEHPQLITPGYSLIFQVDRILYELHTDLHGKLNRLCNEVLLIGPISVKPSQSAKS